eukprot:GHVT01043139.1.p1 GENE.GHVT01043139.1~~GHVT01043139.1.p1  ORF type:complete len:577 (-),score=120.28 GHVT01043139.1:667-2397(-)
MVRPPPLQVFGSDSAIVFDFGSSLSKVGFSGEASPRLVIKSDTLSHPPPPRLGGPVEIEDELRGLLFFETANDTRFPHTIEPTQTINDAGRCLSVPTVSAAAWNARLLPFLTRLFAERLLVNPKEQPVVVLESIVALSAFKHALAHVLFHVLEVPCITFLNAQLAPLYTCGLDSGIVIDIGYQETRVLPCVYGVPIFSALQRIDLGGRTIDARLRRLLRRRARQQRNAAADELVAMAAESSMECAKVRACYVRCEAPLDPSAHAGRGGGGSETVRLWVGQRSPAAAPCRNSHQLLRPFVDEEDLQLPAYCSKGPDAEQGANFKNEIQSLLPEQEQFIHVEPDIRSHNTTRDAATLSERQKKILKFLHRFFFRRASFELSENVDDAAEAFELLLGRRERAPSLAGRAPAAGVFRRPAPPVVATLRSLLRFLPFPSLRLGACTALPVGLCALAGGRPAKFSSAQASAAMAWAGGEASAAPPGAKEETLRRRWTKLETPIIDNSSMTAMPTMMIMMMRMLRMRMMRILSMRSTGLPRVYKEPSPFACVAALTTNGDDWPGVFFSAEVPPSLEEFRRDCC